MPTSAEHKQAAAAHIREARSLNDQFDGQPMPVQVGKAIASLLSRGRAETILAAEAETKESRQPVYKHQMLDDGGAEKDAHGLVPGGGTGGMVPEGSASLPLSPEQKVQDALGFSHVSEEAIWGALGVIVKDQVVPVGQRERAEWSRALGTKDMLESGGAGVLVPAVIGSYVIDLMRARVVVQRLGARTVPMTSKTTTIPRITGDVTASWLSEGATLTPSDATLDGVTLTAQRLDAECKVSLELEEDSDPVDIGRVVSQSLAAAFALKVDAAALRGTGTPPEPQGIRNTSGVTLYAPGTNGDLATWDVALALVKAVMQANAQPTGIVMTPGSAITLAGLKEATTNAYLSAPAIFDQQNIRFETTTSLPTSLTKGTGTSLTEWYAGDWRQLLIGVRTGFSFQRAAELHRAEGKVGLFARMRVGIGVEHPAAFAVATFVDD